MKLVKLTALSAVTIGVLTACGGGGDPGQGSSFDLGGGPGSLLASPVKLTTLTQAAFTAGLTQSGAVQVTGVPICDVTFNYFQYGTVGGVGESTMASGGIMVPSGSDAACNGPRPVLLYARGTSTDKNKNMASPQDTEAALIAGMYAAQGYIVVAPNYAGYEASPLPYHPYLNLEQQAQDVVDALSAARKGFAAVNVSASNKLFVTGYSQGGFVSMAAQRKLQLAGTPVTAGAHHSGPYNLGLFGDLVFSGQVNLGATLFSPLLNTSLQRTYGNIYASPSEMYEDAFVTGIESLLPSTTPLNTLLSSGKLPATFLFSGAAPEPAFAPFFGTPNLIKTSYRNAVLADAGANPTSPQHPLRVAAYKNDLLHQNWTPTQPMLLCGGSADPTVFFAANTTTAKAYFNGKGVPDAAVTVLDVDSAPTGAGDPFALVKGGFAQAKAATNTAGGASAVVQAYHSTLVSPFCNAAARGYFAQF